MLKLRFLACSLLLVGIAWSIYNWVVVDEGLRYFAGDHRRILLLLAIVAIGTPGLLGYRKLTFAWKRLTDLWLLGTLAAAATLFAIYAVFMTARLAGFLRETDQFWVALMATFLPTVMAGCLWWAFSRIRRGKPR